MFKSSIAEPSISYQIVKRIQVIYKVSLHQRILGGEVICGRGNGLFNRSLINVLRS